MSVVLNLMIGLITPPVGYLLDLAAGIADIGIDRVVRAITPFLVALLAVLAVVTYWPGLILAVPNLLQPTR